MANVLRVRTGRVSAARGDPSGSEEMTRLWKVDTRACLRGLHWTDESIEELTKKDEPRRAKEANERLRGRGREAGPCLSTATRSGPSRNASTHARPRCCRRGSCPSRPS